MSAQCEQVIGSTCDDQVNKGETLDLNLAYTDSNGDPLDLSSATVEIAESYPTTLADNLTLTVTNAAGGIVRCVLDAADNDLPVGRLSWFRVRTVFGAADEDVTPKIWIQIT